MKKILLLHGWNASLYARHPTDAGKTPWYNRESFIAKLQEEGFEVVTPSFPGFVGWQGEEPVRPWNMDDYVRYCDALVEEHDPDAIAGYSFGGAVAASWKATLGKGSGQKVILISPALKRAYEKPLHPIVSFIKRFFPRKVVALVRGAYLRHIAKNSFYAEGTAFLRESYLAIVRVSCEKELAAIPPSEILLVYGSDDTATPLSLVANVLQKIPGMGSRVHEIRGGGHDIANTHADKLVHAIKTFMR